MLMQNGGTVPLGWVSCESREAGIFERMEGTGGAFFKNIILLVPYGI